MSKEIIGKVEREKGGFFSKSYVYGVDKDGNVFKESYNIFKDPYTLVTICVILMGVLYYTSLLNNPLTVKNIDSTCENLGDICGKYLPLKDLWISKHPGEKLNVREIINTEIKIEYNYSNMNSDKINLSSFK